MQYTRRKSRNAFLPAQIRDYGRGLLRSLMNEAREKLGYVPEQDNIVFSRLMDAGKCLSAKVISVKYQEYFTKISISIYLADY